MEPDTNTDYLPVRMLNEFVYCPRLFFYEYVEGLFVESADTTQGTISHQRVDTRGRRTKQIATEDEIEETRKVNLSSPNQKIIAVLDILEESDGFSRPVDYKKGRPRKVDLIEDANSDEGANGSESPDKTNVEAWENDKIQLCAQALILEDNGRKVDYGFIYYVATKQRVRVDFSEEL